MIVAFGFVLDGRLRRCGRVRECGLKPFARGRELSCVRLTSTATRTVWCSPSIFRLHSRGKPKK